MKSIIISISLFLSCPEDHFEHIKQYAHDHNMTIESVIEEAIKDRLDLPFNADIFVDSVVDFERLEDWDINL